MKRFALFLLVAGGSAHAEEAHPTTEKRLQAAAHELIHDEEGLHDKAWKDLVAAGTAALPVIRAEMKQHADPRALSILATMIEVLEISPRKRKVRASIGPFGLSADGKQFATWVAPAIVLLNLGVEEFRMEPGDGVTARFPIRDDAPRLPPVFFGSGSLGVPKRSRLEIALYDARTAELRGSLVAAPAMRGMAGRERMIAVLRLDDERFVSVTQSCAWVEKPLGTRHELTMGVLKPSLLSAAAFDGGVVALRHVGEKLIVDSWSGTSMKLERERLDLLENADLLGVARKKGTIAVGSSTEAEVAVCNSGSPSFDKPRTSGFGANVLSALAVSPDGAWVAVGGADGKVLIRLSTTWELLAELIHDGKVIQLAFSDNGTTLGVQAGEELHLYEVRNR